MNFAVDMTHIVNFSVEVNSKFLENAFKAFYKIRYDSNSCIPRDDYVKLLDLVFYCLNENSFDTYRFLLPGAQHQAHWISSATYAAPNST